MGTTDGAKSRPDLGSMRGAVTGAISQGPVGDFDTFYRNEFASIAVIAGAMTGDRLGGEEIARQALASARLDWDELSAHDKPAAWVRRTAITMAANGRRRRRALMRARFGGQRRSGADANRLGEPAVWSALGVLPPGQRAVAALHYVDDLSVADIANVLEIAVSVAASSLARARVTLAVMLGESP